MPRTMKPPERADAARVAEVWVAEGVSRVLLFGSVARGEATEDSDIDLVAIYDDLDYAERLDQEAELSGLGRAAVGHPVDVLVTDRPEWKMRSEQVITSFESWIATDAMVLADRGPGRVDWDKETVRPGSDHEEAVDRLYQIYTGLLDLNRVLEPASTEKIDRSIGNEIRALSQYHVRLEKACGHVQYIVESAVKALLHATSRRRVEWSHGIGALCHQLREPHRQEVFARIAPIGAKRITNWHQASRYLGTEKAGKPATPRLVREMAAVACSVAWYTVEQFDESTAHTEFIRGSVGDVIDRLTGRDLETGEPLDPGDATTLPR